MRRGLGWRAEMRSVLCHSRRSPTLPFLIKSANRNENSKPPASRKNHPDDKRYRRGRFRPFPERPLKVSSDLREDVQRERMELAPTELRPLFVSADPNC